MPRRCELTGIKVASGNRVSHANNKTRRRFLPNLQKVAFFSFQLGQTFHLRVSVRALRMIERSGGLDVWLAKARGEGLGKKAIRIKQRLLAQR